MNNNIQGYVGFVLHAHLPFVHHPESEDYLEEQWLFEAISETYIPLLTNFEKLVEEKVDFRITMSMTPPLLNMLDNKLLQERYIKYLKTHIELAEKEIARTTYDERVNRLAHYYYDRYSSDLNIFENKYKRNIIQGFKHFQDIGVLEIITCGATHGYFPILYVTEQTVKAQIAVGVQTYEKYFGKKPRGIWLPECGYVPEADKYLREFGIEYVITETHGILYSNPAPLYGTFAPIVSPMRFLNGNAPACLPSTEDAPHSLIICPWVFCFESSRVFSDVMCVHPEFRRSRFLPGTPKCSFLICFQIDT